MAKKKMSIFLEIKLTGGVGNQLFQYATARNLSEKHKIPFLLLNTENYRNDPLARKFALKNFNIKGTVLNNRLIQKLFHQNSYPNKIISTLPIFHRVKEIELKLIDLPKSRRLVMSLNGYWQSDKYFKSIRPALINELTLIDGPPLPLWEKRKNTVAVHVRRTDYLLVDGFGTLNEQYYQDAIVMMRNKVRNPTFIFFSDDIGWCKAKFRNEDFIYCEEKEWDTDYLQLYLMSKCSHQIIANSSFSWWGAWINNNPDKIILRPEKPFLDSNYMYESYYPEEWIGVRNT